MTKHVTCTLTPLLLCGHLNSQKYLCMMQKHHLSAHLGVSVFAALNFVVYPPEL